MDAKKILYLPEGQPNYRIVKSGFVFDPEIDPTDDIVRFVLNLEDQNQDSLHPNQEPLSICLQFSTIAEALGFFLQEAVRLNRIQRGDI